MALSNDGHGFFDNCRRKCKACGKETNKPKTIRLGGGRGVTEYCECGGELERLGVKKYGPKG